jgi:uncharacterized membrane-anchored protein YhcB (DUF1043 family)
MITEEQFYTYILPSISIITGFIIGLIIRKISRNRKLGVKK